MSKRNRNNTKKQPNQNKYHLVFVLIALSIVCVGSRIWFFGQAGLLDDDKLWRLTIDLTVSSEAKATAVQIFPPFENPHLHILQRTLRHPGFNIRNWSENKNQGRSFQALATKSGEQYLSAEYILHQTNILKFRYWIKNKQLNTQERENFLLDSDKLQIKSSVVVETLKQISNGETDRYQIIDAIFNYLHRFANSHEKNDLHVPSTLAKKNATTLDRALTMVALSRAAGIPTRIVTGLILKEEFDPTPHYWVEVYIDNKWLAYDVQYGYRHELPVTYLSMRRNNENIVQVLNGDLLKLDYDLEREFNFKYLPKVEGRSILSVLDLKHLPMDARDELALLLLLPFCVLISALWQNFVGLKSYGVFTSTLLALALVYNDKLMTIVIFIVVCTLAIGGRSIFPDTIKRMPRLAIIFTLVAIIMALSVSTLDYFKLSQGGKVILLPIIILTSLVDRLYQTIEDNGFEIAIRRLIWTIIVSLLCLPVIQFQTLGQLLISYPEIHLITLAIFLLISTYKGCKLFDQPLFKFLAESEVSSKNNKSSAGGSIS